MADQQPAPRVSVDLPVRVWGMGANEQPFFQSAHAQNVSSTGACLSGIEHELKVGDVIGVQYEGKKARCKIVWVIDAGGLKKIQVGVQLIAEQECPWQAQLSTTEPSGPVAPSPFANRRKFVRHKISFPLELRDERVNTPMRVNATDISGNGCYVETIMPLNVDTSLKVDFFMDAEHISTTATVRTRDPGVGMGIEFTGMPPDNKQRFQDYLEKMDPGMPGSGLRTPK